MKKTAIAVVTGGSRGIGRATVTRLAERGVRSIFTYRAKRAEADKVLQVAAAHGADGVALPLDTADAGAIRAFADVIRSTLKGFGAERFDYLVNNAGISSAATFMGATEADLDAQYQVNFKGVFLLSQALAPQIADGGRIVNISSGLARFSINGRAVYGPMKAAIESLTRYMALELAPRRISVNCIAPGATATDFSGGMVRDNPDVNRAVASHTALGRAGLPEDIGGAIAALLSDDFGFVNAQRIEVAGGIHI